MAKYHADRARALVGRRFRPQGRGDEGLDCIGLVVAVFAIDPGAVRRDYSLRGSSDEEVRAGLERFFRPVREGEARPGDVLMMQAASDQMHLAVLTDRGLVHAHAGLRRVVETPGSPVWPVLGTFRFRGRKRS